MQILAESIVALVVLLIAGWGGLRLYKFYKKAKYELNEVVSFIERNIEGKPLLSVFPYLEERLEKSHYAALATAWREFDASLVKTPRNISTAVRTEMYFNDHSLIDGPLQADLLRNIPGILTGLGIVGTFLGVIIGLYGYNSQDLTSVRNSISHLLQSVQGAFIVSFMAVFSAIIFTGIEKILTSKLYILVARFQQSLGRIFSHSVSDEYLQRMVEQLEEQGGALKSFSHDLSETIKITLEELVQNQNATLRESNLQFAETVKQALVDQLSPAMLQLTEVMRRVQQTQADAGHTVIQQMVQDFKKTLDTANSRQLEAVTGAIEGTTGLLNDVYQGMNNFVSSLRDQSKQQQTQVSQQMVDLVEQAKTQQSEMERRLVEFTTCLSQDTQQWQRELGNQQIETITALRLGVEPLMETMSLTSKEVLNRLDNSAKVLQEEREFLEQSINRSKDILVEHQRILEESKATGISWRESSYVFREAGKELERLSSQLDQGQKLLDRSIDAFHNLLKQTALQTQSQQDLVEDYKQFSKQMQQDWGNQRQILLEMDESISKDLKDFAEVSSKALREYLTQVDTNLEKIIQSMRGLAEPLAESVEELTEVLENQSQHSRQIRTGR